MTRLRRLGIALARIRTDIARRRRQRRRMQALAHLTDDQLRDIGIAPWEVRQSSDFPNLRGPEDWFRFLHW